VSPEYFSLLGTVVVPSAIVPTAFAERWFLPDVSHVRRRSAYRESEEHV
jgi:hypothetical protein